MGPSEAGDRTPVLDLQGGELPDVERRLAEVQSRLGLTFNDRGLLLQALVHRSAVLEREHEGGPSLGLLSNERLEFLGDAVLSMLVAHYAYRRYPDYNEGQLTEVRSALVRRSTLAALAEDLALAEHMYMGRAERRGDGRGRATVLAEALEAVLAAIFLDQGLERASLFLEGQLDGKVDALLERANRLNPKSRLQELSQAHLRLIPQYTLLERRGPAHDSRFVVEVQAGEHIDRGEGTSKQGAEQQAARSLLERLEPLFAAAEAAELHGDLEEPS